MSSGCYTTLAVQMPLFHGRRRLEDFFSRNDWRKPVNDASSRLIPPFIAVRHGHLHNIDQKWSSRCGESDLALVQQLIIGPGILFERQVNYWHG